MRRRRIESRASLAVFLLLAVPFCPAAEDGLNTTVELRERWEIFDHSNFGADPKDTDGYLLGRLLLGADYRWQQVAVMAQIGSMTENGRTGGPRSTDEDRADLTQAFIALNPERNTELRLGRQELVFGSSRLIGVRDGPNVRLSFDAIRVWALRGGWRVDGFFGRPVKTSPREFDDHADANRSIAGIYAVSPPLFSSSEKVDIYLLDYRNRVARFDRGLGEEHRRMLGSRFWGSADAWDWNWEAGWQFGDFGPRPIRAWALASETAYTWKEAWLGPRAGIRFNAISGDRRGESLGTFDSFFPSPFFFGETKIVGPANIHDIVGSLELKPSEPWSIDFVWGTFWRMTEKDGIYNYSGTLLRRSALDDSMHIGSEFSVRCEWHPNPAWTWTLAAATFRVGRFLSRGGGRDMQYFALTSTYRFSSHEH